MILYIILVGIIIGLLVYMIREKKEISNICKQIESNKDEYKNIHTKALNDTVERLVTAINTIYDNAQEVRARNESIDEELRRSIANISHDLRTPLTAIKGYQQLIDSEKLSHDQKEKLHIAMKHTSELGDLIEHFFEYSRLANSEPKIEIKRVNITSVIIECIISVIPQFESKNLKVNFDGSNAFFAFVDKEMFIRIILNLLGNCLKYSISDVDILIDKCDENIVVSVKNKVLNLNKDDEKRIFNRFYSLDPSRNRSGGLGLSIVKLLSEKMGGKSEASIDKNTIEIKVYLVK